MSSTNWFNTGGWAGLRIDFWYICLYQLCYAANERQDYAGIELTEWNTIMGKKTIKSTSPLAMNNFIGMYIAGQAVYENIIMLRSAIEDLCESGKFADPNGTQITALSDILSESWESDMRPAKYNVWHQLKHCLEQLKYVKVPDMVVNATTGEIASPWSGTITSLLQSTDDRQSPYRAYYDAIHDPDYQAEGTRTSIELSATEEPNNTGYYEGLYIPFSHIENITFDDGRVMLYKCKLNVTVKGGSAQHPVNFRFYLQDELHYTEEYDNEVIEQELEQITTSLSLSIDPYYIVYDDDADSAYAQWGRRDTDYPVLYHVVTDAYGILDVTYG